MLFHLVRLSFLIGCLTCTLVNGDYVKYEFTQDGHNNGFLYPQMTCSLSDQSIVVYHYNLDGQSGKSGLSIITRSGSYVRSIGTIQPSINPPLTPPGQFVNDPFLAYYPYGADYMRCYVDSSLNTEVIEMIIPVETSFNGGVEMNMVGFVIDTYGNYLRPFDVSQRYRASIPYQGVSLPITSIQSTRSIIIGGINQPFTQSIVLTNSWQALKGRVKVTADFQIAQSTSGTRLVGLFDDSNQAYPLCKQMVGIFDPLTGSLIEVIDPSIVFDTNQLVVYGQSQITIANDQSILLVQPSDYDAHSVYLFVPSGSPNTPTFSGGDISSVWFTNLGYLQGQAVLSDSSIVTTTVSSMNLLSRTTSIKITSPGTKTVTSTITTISGLTQDAINAGASANIADYLFVTLYADSNDRLFLSNYFQDGYSSGVQPGVLILSLTGQFIDWYTGYGLPQTVSLDRQGRMLVPDRFNHRLYVVDLSTRQTVVSAYCGGCLGAAFDNVHGGYVVTTSNSYMNSAAIEYMDTNFNLVSGYGTIQYTFMSGWDDQAALSNPITDSSGRIFVLVSGQAGQSRSTAVLHVYDASNNQLIKTNDWSNPQPRGMPGVSQLSYGLSLSQDRNDQSCVVSTIDFGQIFKARPY